MDFEPLLTVPQTAQVFNNRPSCIRRWILERKIKVVKVGRLVRIPASEVQRLIDSGTRPARPAR